jgi:hypothetical protein
MRGSRAPDSIVTAKKVQRRRHQPALDVRLACQAGGQTYQIEGERQLFSQLRWNISRLRWNLRECQKATFFAVTMEIVWILSSQNLAEGRWGVKTQISSDFPPAFRTYDGILKGNMATFFALTLENWVISRLRCKVHNA